MSEPITSCMGGWCHKRDRCQHYSATHRKVIAERLCEPGQFDAFEPRFDQRFAQWVAAKQDAQRSSD